MNIENYVTRELKIIANDLNRKKIQKDWIIKIPLGISFLIKPMLASHLHSQIMTSYPNDGERYRFPDGELMKINSISVYRADNYCVDNYCHERPLLNVYISYLNFDENQFTPFEEYLNWYLSEKCLNYLSSNYHQEIDKFTNGRYLNNVKAILLYSMFEDGSNTDYLIKQYSNSSEYFFEIETFEIFTKIQSRNVGKVRHTWSFDETNKPLINYEYLLRTNIHTYHITISVDAKGENHLSEYHEPQIEVIKSKNSEPVSYGERSLDEAGIKLFEIEHYGDANYIEFDHETIFDSDIMSISLVKNLRRMSK